MYDRTTMFAELSYAAAILIAYKRIRHASKKKARASLVGHLNSAGLEDALDRGYGRIWSEGAEEHD